MARRVAQQVDPNRELADRLKRREQVLDSIQDEISVYITNLLSGNVPHKVADEARRQLRMADEYESVSDYLANLDTFDRKLRRDGYRFTAEHRTGLNELNRHLLENLSQINRALKQGNRNVLTETGANTRRIKGQIKQLRRSHLDELSSGAITPLVSVAFLAALNAYAQRARPLSEHRRSRIGRKVARGDANLQCQSSSSADQLLGCGGVSLAASNRSCRAWSSDSRAIMPPINTQAITKQVPSTC